MKISYTYTISFQIIVCGFISLIYKLRENEFPLELALAIIISIVYTFMLTYDILSVIYLYMEIIQSLKRVKFSKNSKFIMSKYFLKK